MYDSSAKKESEKKKSRQKSLSAGLLPATTELG